jgi:hypothetical protein
MDAQVDVKLSRTTDDRGAERAVQIRLNQSKERNTLQNEISSAQKKISSLQEQRAPIASQARKVEAEVGPIKYIAALIYGDNPDANLLEHAVRWVIILIVLVFDPLALVLILAADQTFAWHREDKKKREGWSQVWQPNSEAWPEWNDLPEATEDFDPRPKYELDDGPLTNEQIDTIKQASGIPQDPNGMPAEDFIKSLEQVATEPIENPVETKNKILERELEAVKATAENLKKKFVNWTNKFKRKN